MSAPILHVPDLERDFILQTDASGVGLGAVLLQIFDGVRCPVLFASRSLSDAEKKYSTIEKECLAIVWAVQKFEFFLYGQNFVIETDHKPLLFIRDNKSFNSRITRWSLILQSFSFTVKYIKGTENVLADSLSRGPDSS